MQEWQSLIRPQRYSVLLVSELLLGSMKAEETLGDLSLDRDELQPYNIISDLRKCVSYSERVKPTASSRRLTTMPQ